MKTYDQLLLARIEQEKLERFYLEEKSDRSQAPRFDKIAKALDDYYFINQLQIYCAYLSYKRIVRPELLDYDERAFRLIDPIVKWIESGEVSNPFLQIYNQIRQLLEQKNLPVKQFDELFQRTFELIKEQDEASCQSVKLDALSFLSNLSIRKVNGGAQVYVSKMFAINNEIINLQTGSAGSRRYKIPAGLFKNMVVVAFKISEADFFAKIKTTHLKPKDKNKGFENATEWATAFVEQYKKRLIKKEQDKYGRFCSAYIAFKNADYMTAYQILNNPIRLRGMFINMAIRQLHLKVLFELQLTDMAVLGKDDVDIKTYCESLRKLIADDKKRKKQMSYHAPYFENFEKLYRQMIRLYFKYRLPYMSKGVAYEKEMRKLSTEIEACTFSYKSWFECKYLQIQQAH